MAPRKKASAIETVKVAKALRNKGISLGQVGNSEEAIRVYDEVVSRFGDSTDLALREQVAKALINKGVSLGKMGKNEEEIRVYDDVVARFGDSTDLALREQVANALINKGITLGQMGKSEEEIRVYDDVVARFGDSTDLALREQVAKALRNKGITLGQMGKNEEEIRVYDEVVSRFGDSTDLALREQVAKALINKGVTFRQMGKNEEEIRVYDDVVARFGDPTDLALREQVAKALINKGVTFRQMGKNEEEIRVYDDVVARFGDPTDLALREQVAKALINKGITFRQMGKNEEATRLYDDVVARFGDSTDLALREQVARALLYKVNIFLDNDNVEDGQTLLSKIETEYFGVEELNSKLGSFRGYLRSRLASKSSAEGGRAGKGQTIVPDSTSRNLTSNLMGYLTEVLKQIDAEKQREYFDKIHLAKERTDHFIREDSQFSEDLSFLLVLREWNSYTPMIPGEEEEDRGGGYFIRHAGEGLVIDPGYDFIENFYRAGGRLSDIDHVIVTHAHDDHTAELEALLMLLHRRWTAKDLPKKSVSLYLSAGVQRKFAGLLDLRDPKYKRIMTLCPVEGGCEQRIALSAEIVLTVLPAYHDDVVTQNTAVGLAFEFTIKNDRRTLIFTGDSGLYPLRLGEDGEKRLYDGNEDTPMLDVAEGKALHERYPEKFGRPDLLVAHIGSIKESEFRPQDSIFSREDEGRWYYVNHLGLLGTLTMLHQLNPVAAIVSEFGSELKGFHFELVDKLQQALHARQKQNITGGRHTFVIPGNLTIAYDIENRRFLCHDTCEFADSEDLCCRQACDYAPKWDPMTVRHDAIHNGGTRTYLFRRTTLPGDENVIYNRLAQDYCRKFFDHELPYHRSKRGS